MSTVGPHRFAEMLRKGQCVKGMRHNGQRIQDSCMQAYYNLTDQDVVEFNIGCRPHTTIKNPGQVNHESTSMTPTEIVKNAELALAAAVLAKAAHDDTEALKARIHDDIALAHATRTLLDGVQSLRLLGATVSAHQVLARFRKELAPLAESYGAKIVLVGDKTTATLVLA